MNKTSYTLSDAIEFAVKNNPRIIQSSKDVEIGTYGISEAKANKMPRLDFNGGATRYRYASPITPILTEKYPLSMKIRRQINILPLKKPLTGHSL